MPRNENGLEPGNNIYAFWTNLTAVSIPQSRHNFLQSRNPEGYFWYSTSSAYFQFRIYFQIPNPSFEKSGNPGSRKTYWPTQQAGSTFLRTNTLACPARSTQYSQDETIRACARAAGQGKRQKGQRFNHINARKTWHGLEGDGSNSSSHKRGLSGFTSGHDESILPAWGFPRWLRQRKGVLFLISQ